MARYDEDPGDSRQHCVHGTFIGSWWGPDYLCGWCEDGVSVHEMECILAAEVASVLAQREAQYETMRATLATFPYDARVATALVDYVLGQPTTA